MAKVKRTAEQVIKAIKGTGGIKCKIAKRLGINRVTVDQYINRYPTVARAYKQEVESVGDDAEQVIVDSIHDGNVSTAKWYATAKLGERGYVSGFNPSDELIDLKEFAKLLARNYEVKPEINSAKTSGADPKTGAISE